MFMAEKGISIPLQSVNLGKKEQFSDRLKAINPRQQVPVLVLDDGMAIAEVPAIWRFLEESYPERPLLGSDATG
jgi:glutathione S-transferase